MSEADERLPASSPLPVGAPPHPLERRSIPRIAACLSGAIAIGDPPGWIPCTLRDIGSGGACIQTPSPIALVELHRLRVDLPSGPLEARVSGRWQRNADPERAIFTGVRFETLNSELARQIEEFMQQRSHELVRFLVEHSDFADLSLDEAMALALCSRLRGSGSSRYMVLAGPLNQSDDSMFIVLEGVVVIETRIRSVRLEVRRVERGGVFGGIAMLAPVKPFFSAVAGKNALMLELEAYSFEYLERSKPLFARRIAEVVISRYVNQLSDCIEEVSGDRPGLPRV